MCATCGCDADDKVKILIPNELETTDEVNIKHDHLGHTHTHDHHHHHHHGHEEGHLHIDLERDVLHKNDLLAQRVRGFLEARNIMAINLVSSPGSGKTTLLEQTISQLQKDLDLYVIEGDQQSTNDALRIQKAGAPAVQINTGKGCHLDAEMVHQAIKKLNPKENSLLLIENVGNLVCPAMFDLGEHKRVVIMSVTEGEDKPIKYPNMFESADICIINKVDLLPYVEFNIDVAKSNALRVNHHLSFFELAASKGENLDGWIQWLKQSVSSEVTQ